MKKEKTILLLVLSLLSVIQFLFRFTDWLSGWEVIQGFVLMVVLAFCLLLAIKSIETTLLKWVEFTVIILLSCLIMEELMCLFDDSFYQKSTNFIFNAGIISVTITVISAWFLRAIPYWIVVNILLLLSGNAYLLSTFFK